MSNLEKIGHSYTVQHSNLKTVGRRVIMAPLGHSCTPDKILIVHHIIVCFRSH